MMRSSRYSPAWLLLLLVPWVPFATVLAPPLGNNREGLWPEWFGGALPNLLGSQEYPAFAATLRWSTIGLLVAAALFACAAWFLLLHIWRSRLHMFQVNNVLDYRGIMRAHLGVVFILSGIFAFAVVLLSPSLQKLRDVPVVGWVGLVVAIGGFGALQFFSTVWAVGSTRRLFRGR